MIHYGKFVAWSMTSNPLKLWPKTSDVIEMVGEIKSSDQRCLLGVSGAVLCRQKSKKDNP